jgi:hypothetical protein
MSVEAFPSRVLTALRCNEEGQRERGDGGLLSWRSAGKRRADDGGMM